MAFQTSITRVVVFFAVMAASLCAQSPGASATPQASPAVSGSPTLTLHTGTRIVLTDVLVEDRDGHPVHGLPSSAFHVFDNGKPETIASFEEHDGAPTSDATAGPEHPAKDVNTLSNDILLHPPAVSDILLLDTTNLGIVDQMYLNEEMEQFVAALPSGDRVALYLRAGEFAVLLQNFTDDHAALLKAVHKAIPRLPVEGARFTSDLGTLRQMVDYLRPLPGRKNLLWLSGGSNLVLLPDASALPPALNMRPVYDELEASRIAVYPIDARGLTVDAGQTMVWQHLQMNDVARATGGEALYDNNGLRQGAMRAINGGARFYTLTYTPHDLRFDNKWHKVKVKIDGGDFQLSYRRGYFDDGLNLQPPPKTERVLLRPEGHTEKLSADREQPIIFNVRALPLAQTPPGEKSFVTDPDLPPPHGNEAAYSLRYTLPVGAFTVNQGPNESIAIQTAVIVINRYGRPVRHTLQEVTVGIDPEKLRAHPGGVLHFDQHINLPSGDDSLYIGVWDKASRRLGTVQVPLEVKK